ncbi:MAG: HAMP domain-containing sensor histidine kinase [Desulfobacterium sp.]|jgi:signal transduction histidine kinase|nr:HAMP domain-containing sensor histidine kinase [Desulfobacterium sp.]
MQFQLPSRWYLHPVFIFACSILALAGSLVITVSWYMEITAALEVIIKKFHIDPGQIFPSKSGMIFLVLTLLVTVVLAGILLAFIYYQRTVRLFRLQHNFIYNFTHELKTPVTSLKIYLETFMRHTLEPEVARKYTGYMLGDVNRLIENINAILNLARIESRSYGAELTHQDLVQVTRNFCEKNSSLFRTLTITIRNPQDLSFVYPVNLFLFEMLLMNILSNAEKYNESKKPSVEILFGVHKQRMYIDFSDNGIGIERQEIRKIFRKFYQAGRHDSAHVRGSGLGLYLVFSIAKIHGWKVAAKSRGKGRGSTFTLTPPRKETADIRGRNLWKMLKKSVSW